MDPLFRHADPGLDREFRNIYRLLSHVASVGGVHIGTTEPSGATEGFKMMWYDPVADVWRIWNGRIWQQFRPGVMAE